MPPIRYAKERLVITRLVNALLRSRAKYYYPDLGLSESYEMQLIANAVYVGQIGGRPTGVSEIARQLDMGRPTVRRRLVELVRRGLVEKKGRYYCVISTVLNEPSNIAVLKANVRRVKAAANELVNLGN